jgi:hypothetical protein
VLFLPVPVLQWAANAREINESDTNKDEWPQMCQITTDKAKHFLRFPFCGKFCSDQRSSAKISGERFFLRASVSPW